MLSREEQRRREQRQIREGKAGILERLRRKYLLPFPMPEADRAELDASFREQFDEACEAEIPELLNAYQSEAKQWFRTAAHTITHLRQQARSNPKQVFELLGLDIRPVARRSTVKKSRRTRADTKFHRERKFRVLAFVGEKSIPLLQRLRGDNLTPPRRFRRGEWQQIAEQWNAAHPDDTVNTPDTLRKLFERALADPTLCRYYVSVTRTAWLGELKTRRLAAWAPVLAELSADPEAAAKLAADLRETAVGMRILADTWRGRDDAPKDLRRFAREVTAAADKLEKKARRKRK